MKPNQTNKWICLDKNIIFFSFHFDVLILFSLFYLRFRSPVLKRKKGIATLIYKYFDLGLHSTKRNIDLCRKLIISRFDSDGERRKNEDKDTFWTVRTILDSLINWFKMLDFNAPENAGLGLIQF